jgi:DNA-binding NarL/FixJ family response regulator
MNIDPIRVLLVEDNPGDAGLIRRMLKAADEPSFELRHVTNFPAGMEQLRSGPVDVLLLDLALPGTSGFETIANALVAAPQVPIIVLTGTDTAQTILECIKAGAKDYFVKSRIDRERLIEVIRRYAKRSDHDASKAN